MNRASGAGSAVWLDGWRWVRGRTAAGGRAERWRSCRVLAALPAPVSCSGLAQDMGSPEVMGQGMKQSHALCLEQAADVKASEATILKVAIDGLDVAPAAHDAAAIVAGHALAPLLQNGRLLVPTLLSLALGRGGGGIAVGRWRRVDADGTVGALTQGDDVVLGSVLGIDQQPVGRLAVAFSDRIHHGPG